MPRPTSKPKSPKTTPRRPSDSKQRASQAAGETTGAPRPPEDAGSPKDPVAVALGRLGGSKEKAPAANKLTPAQRRELARRAARSKA